MCMAYVTKKVQMRYIELGNYIAEYNDGDVIILDGVKDITPLYPIKPDSVLVSVCCKGWHKMNVNGRSYELTEGSLFLCPSNAKVVVGEHSSNFQSKVLCLSDHIIRGLLREKMDVWHHSVYVSEQLVINIPELCNEEFNYYFSLIRSKLRGSNSDTPHEILLALLRALLLELCLLLEGINGTGHEQKISQGKMLFNRFLSLVSNSQVKRLPINHYAGLLAITPKYLTMLCLKYSDKTASEWVAQYTVEEIRYYLKSTELSIKEISAKLGFSNMSHFGSYVRKHLGVSPSEFRNNKKVPQ